MSGENDEVLLVELNDWDQADPRAALLEIGESLGTTDAIIGLDEEDDTLVRVELLRQPTAYVIVEFVAESVYLVLEEDFSTFEQAQKALKSVGQRKIIQDPRKVVVLATWSEFEPDPEPTVVEPEPEPEPEPAVVEPEVVPPPIDYLKFFEPPPRLGASKWSKSQYKARTRKRIDEAHAKEGWIAFQEAMKMLGVRYQQLYERALVHKRMHTYVHYSTRYPNGRYYVRIEDLLAWKTQRAENYTTIGGGIRTKPLTTDNKDNKQP